MKCSSCRGSSNLQFTNSTDDGVDRMAVSQGILYICVPPRYFKSSLKPCRSRITAVHVFAYINVLKIYCAPLCVIMLLNRFSFSVLTRSSLTRIFPVFSYQFFYQLTAIHKNLGCYVIGGPAKFSIFNFLYSVITKFGHAYKTV